MPGVEVNFEKLEAGDEEQQDFKISSRSRADFIGYLNSEEETKTVVKSDGCVVTDHVCSVDSEGFVTVLHADDKHAKVEARVCLELGCVSHCVAVDMEGDRIGVILSLECQYDNDGGPTDQLSQDCQAWFLSSGWDVRTVSEVLRDLKQEDGGITHCLQAGIDRANQGAACPSEWIDQWEVKATCLSFASGEIHTSNHTVNRHLVIDRYQEQIRQLFSGSSTSCSGQATLAANQLFQAAFPSQLSQIMEEEERQSSRNSVDKETESVRTPVTAARDEGKKMICDVNNDKEDLANSTTNDDDEVTEDDSNQSNTTTDQSKTQETQSNKRKISRT